MMRRLALLSIALLPLAGCAGAPAPATPLPFRAVPASEAAEARPRLPPGGVARLEQVIAIGLDANPDVRTARAAAAVAEAEVVTAGQFRFNPEVQTSAVGNPGAVRSGDATLTLGVSQTLETGGQRDRRTEVAERGLAAARARAADAERLARASIATAFFDGLFAERRRAIANGQRDLAEDLLAISEARLGAGDISRVEVNLVRLSARQAEAATVTAVRDVETSKAALRALIGLRAEDPIAPTGEIATATAVPIERDLADRALARRPDLAALREEEARAVATVSLERASRWPDLTLGVLYQYNRTSIDAPGGALSSADDLFGASMTLPLPLWNRREGQILTAEREARRADAAAMALEATIRRDVASGLSRVRAARARATLYESEILPLAAKNLDDTREAFRLGQVGTLDVLRAQDERFAVAVASVEAARERAVAEVALDAAVGGGAP